MYLCVVKSEIISGRRYLSCPPSNERENKRLVFVVCVSGPLYQSPLLPTESAPQNKHPLHSALHAWSTEASEHLIYQTLLGWKWVGTASQKAN